jgi:type IV pilus assembly protein PilV
MTRHDGLNTGFGTRSRGFTLLEVMIALIITSIGLLGIAKIHALAYSSTATAGTRSIVALQAAGLATSMHANRSYWAGNTVPAQVVISGTNVQDANLGPAAATLDTCQSATTPSPCYCVAGYGPTPCTNDLMAAFDLHNYAFQLNAALANSNPITTITCAAIPSPTNCTIKVQWTEKAVSVNKQGANAAPLTFAPDYLLYVEP